MSFKKFSFIFLLIATAITSRSQSAAEVIAKYIAFTGGSGSWKKLKTLTCAGTYNYGGMEFPFQSWSKGPNLYMYKVSFKGKSFTQAYDGHTGWRIDGFKNEKKKTILTGKEATGMANEFDVELESPFLDYERKGHTATLEGMDTVNGKPCFKIKLTRQNGDTATYSFDNTTFALMKKNAVSKNAELGHATLDILYADYKTVAGIKWPTKITCTSKGQDILIITINDFKENLPVAAASFKP